MWCKKCNIETNADYCPVCLEETVEDTPVKIYWCRKCHTPIIQAVTQADKGLCPICKSGTTYLSSDIRPVFPEERLFVEILPIQSSRKMRKIKRFKQYILILRAKTMGTKGIKVSVQQAIR